MEESTASFADLAATSKHFARRLLTMGENRLELLTVELQEERERLLLAFLITVGMSIFGLLAGMTLTAAIVYLFWGFSPAGVLLGLTVLYGVIGLLLYRRLKTLMREWHTLAASLDQLRKDRASLEKILS
jgi:uncharacterized membrane protein YqjE